MRISDWSSDVCSSDLTPTRPTEGENDRWILDPGAIVGNGEKRSPIGVDDLEVDRARTRPACVLDKLGENIAERVIEEAGDSGDGGRIDLAVDRGGKGQLGLLDKWKVSDRKSTRLNSSH